MSTQHTPTPWTISGNEIVSEDAPWRAVATGRAETDRLNKRNAAFIVRACNSHDALVAALRDAYMSAHAEHNPVIALRDIKARLGAALAAVEGK